MTDECLACALAARRRPLPGGRIFRTELWLVEHCVGPLGRGTLIVKPERHVTAVASLSAAEAAELDPLLRQASWVAGQLTGADQVYNCLWSHLGGRPGHIHYVVHTLQVHGAEGAAREPDCEVRPEAVDHVVCARDRGPGRLHRQPCPLRELRRDKPPDERNVDPHRVRRP